MPGRVRPPDRGSGQYGDVEINLLPQKPGELRVRRQDRRRRDPAQYIPAVDQGIREAMESGILAGYTVVDVKIELVDGSYHDVDSSEENAPSRSPARWGSRRP